MKKFNLIVTVGPAILNKDKMMKIDAFGDCIYRINGAHVNPDKVLTIIEDLRNMLPQPRIMLDLPGNKIRTVDLTKPIRFEKGKYFKLYENQVNYPQFFSHLKKGDIILANDSMYTFEVAKTYKTSIDLLSHSDGLLYSNKGLHVRGIHKNIPYIFEKDRILIEAAYSAEIDYLSLSFVRTADDIRLVKKILKKSDIQIVAKVETMAAVHNLSDIFKEVQLIVIDRGDLSTETGMIDLLTIQDRIVESAKREKIDVYLATQFLKNMEENPVPLIAEVIDLCRTILSGVSGIQLSEETAVGKYPIMCVKLVFDILKNSSTRL